MGVCPGGGFWRFTSEKTMPYHPKSKQNYSQLPLLAYYLYYFLTSPPKLTEILYNNLHPGVRETVHVLCILSPAQVAGQKKAYCPESTRNSHEI